jgi:hypothetical protein
MPYGTHSFTTVINTADTCSSVFAINGFDSLGIWAPGGLTSCQLFLAVGFGDTAPVSASMVRLSLTMPVSGQVLPWTWPVQNGSAAATVPLDGNPWTWARIVSGVSQPNLATFNLVGRRRH